MWKRWLPVLLPALLFALLLPFFAEALFRWFRPLVGEWLMMDDVAVLPAVTVMVGSTVAVLVPPVAVWVLVTEPVVLVSSRACATPLVPAAKSAAPKAAATALRVFIVCPRLSREGVVVLT